MNYFIPNPSDQSMETLNNFKKDCSNDVFFALSHGVHRGTLKTGKYDDRSVFIRKLFKTYAGIKGTEIYNSFVNGSMIYVCAILKK